MKPLRMCMVCRTRKEKETLYRIVCHKEQGVNLDKTGKLPGRGAYICKSRECVALAQKRRVLERAFSRQIEPAVYTQLEEVCHES